MRDGRALGEEDQRLQLQGREEQGGLAFWRRGGAVGAGNVECVTGGGHEMSLETGGLPAPSKPWFQV